MADAHRYQVQRPVPRGRLGLDETLDEILWRTPPWTNMPGGYALADTEVARQPIRKGDALILSYAAANIDPRVGLPVEFTGFA